MKPIYFKGGNATYAKTQEQYLNLPAHKSSEGIVTTCWELTFKERLKILFGSYIFLKVHTFNKPLQPLKMSLRNNKEGKEGK